MDHQCGASWLQEEGMPLEQQLDVFSCLDFESLLRLGECSKYHETLINTHPELWAPLVKHIETKKEHRGTVLPNRTAVTACYRDAANRNELQKGDLVVPDSAIEVIPRPGRPCIKKIKDLKSGPIFHFHFKPEAGATWISEDPHYQQKPCRKLVFLKQGHLKQVRDDGTLVDPDFFASDSVRWRTVMHPLLDGNDRPVGSYIRIIIGGREVPTYIVRRHSNWGFVMESCWGVFTSFPLDGPLEYKITGNLHWREAFLYNMGLRILPCGPTALVVFDQKWKDAVDARKRRREEEEAEQAKRARLEE